MTWWASWVHARTNRKLQRRLLRLEGLITLTNAYLLIKLLPFPWLERLMNRDNRRQQLRGTARDRMIGDVRWAIERATSTLPWEIVCFPRALAAQLMLRRYGVSTTLYYGAATRPEQGLTAHTWLQDGANGVIEHEQASDFHCLTSYPQR